MCKFEILDGPLGPIYVFRDILCMPAQDVYNVQKHGRFLVKAGPVWPSWEDDLIVRHFVDNKPRDIKPDVSEPEVIIEEPVAWGGILYPHFGHFVADLCVPRWPPILTKFPDITFLFVIWNLSDLTSWMREIIDYFGIKNYIILKKPALIRTLIAGPQIERLITGIYDKRYVNPYLDFLDNLASMKVKKHLPGEVCEKIFVSRATQLGRIAGEEYLSRAFESIGFKVIYPEKLSVMEQLRLYYNARTIVFSEGSAVHCLQLLGRFKANILIINRRKKSYIAKEQLQYRTSNIKYIDAVLNDIKSSIGSRIPAIIDIDMLTNELRENKIFLSIDPTEFHFEVLRELKNIIISNKKSSHSLKDEIVDFIISEMKRLNIFGDFIKLIYEEINQFSKDTSISNFLQTNQDLIDLYLSTLEKLKNELYDKLKLLDRTFISNYIKTVDVNRNLHLSVALYSILSDLEPTNIPINVMYATLLRQINCKLSEKMLFDILYYQMKNKILNRTTIIQHLINKFKYKVYLEIGVERGLNFLQIIVPYKIAVDPKFQIPMSCRNAMNEFYFEVTSDEFFRNPPDIVLKEGIDIVFIDGLHTYEQSLRDVENSLKYLTPNGVIILHDCLPDSPATAAPTLREAMAHPQYKGAWTGEVYKTILHLRSTRPDLFVAVVNCDWGVGIVYRGKPENMLDLSLDQIKEMSYEEFSKNKERYLNLKPPTWFYEHFEIES